MNGDGLSSSGVREAAVKMSRTATIVWTLLSVKKTFTAVAEVWFRIHVTDVLGSVQDCYLGYVLDDGLTNVLRVLTKCYGHSGEKQ